MNMNEAITYAQTCDYYLHEARNPKCWQVRGPEYFDDIDQIYTDDLEFEGTLEQCKEYMAKIGYELFEMHMDI